jgi:hypothetical protein
MKKYAYLGDPLADPVPPELMEILDRYRGQKDALITVMADIQRHYGYLPEKQLRYTARELEFPLAQVYGVATFYNLLPAIASRSLPDSRLQGDSLPRGAFR